VAVGIQDPAPALCSKPALAKVAAQKARTAPQIDLHLYVNICNNTTLYHSPDQPSGQNPLLHGKLHSPARVVALLESASSILPGQKATYHLTYKAILLTINSVKTAQSTVRTKIQHIVKVYSRGIAFG
jgi:hypothetical protein